MCNEGHAYFSRHRKSRDRNQIEEINLRSDNSRRISSFSNIRNLRRKEDFPFIAVFLVSRFFMCFLKKHFSQFILYVNDVLCANL